MTKPFDATAGNHSELDRLYGVYPALVTDINDPDSQGRVKITLPSMPDGKGSRYEAWARLTTLMAGNNRGTWFIPDVRDEVVVVFEAGDPARPYVIGALWNGQDQPPESMDGAGRNFKKTIRSRNGVKITLNDQDGQESFKVETPGGQKLTLLDGPGRIQLEDDNGNKIELKPGEIRVSSSSKITVHAESVNVSAGSVKIDTGMAEFSGTVKCQTLITKSVVSESYTHGAGNVM